MSYFDGNAFYNVYKDADFLRVDQNVERILTRGYLIRQKIKSLPVGHSLAIEGMQLARNTPLMIKNVGKNVTVEDFEFTYDRLSGLVAAYTYVHRHRYPTIRASEAKALGLEWDNGNEEQCRLYLSAVSGTEHMIDQFSYLPLLCGLRKFQLWNMPLETVISLGLVRSYEGISMAKLLKQNFYAVKRLWMLFPDTTVTSVSKMESFQLNSKPTTIFSGPIFYQTYKESDFLRVDANVESILSRGYLIRQKVKSLPAGHLLKIEGMELARNVPLTIKNTGVGANVEDFEFTYNRLTGLVATFAFENRQRFPVMESSDAKALGLEWDNGNKEKCKLYLSAVSGTENMIDQFSFFPFLCGMRKFQLKKMPLKLVTGMGLVKNNEGVKMATLLKKNLETTRRVWMMFPNTSLEELQALIDGTPELKKLFHG